MMLMTPEAASKLERHFNYDHHQQEVLITHGGRPFMVSLIERSDTQYISTVSEYLDAEAVKLRRKGKTIFDAYHGWNVVTSTHHATREGAILHGLYELAVYLFGRTGYDIPGPDVLNIAIHAIEKTGGTDEDGAS